MTKITDPMDNRRSWNSRSFLRFKQIDPSLIYVEIYVKKLKDYYKRNRRSIEEFKKALEWNSK